MAKQKTSFTLSEDALRLLKQVAERSGVSMAAMLELLIRAKAKKEKIE